MNYSEAKPLADAFVELIKPYCKRIEIAGSIRREKQYDIKDIEIVCIPDGLYLDQLFLLDTKKSFDKQQFQYIKSGPKYKQLIWNEKGVKIDLFICRDPNYWGMLYLIRTGSAGFSHWILTQWKIKTSGKCIDNVLHDAKGNKFPCKEEEDVFKLLGIDYIEPTKRNYP